MKKLGTFQKKLMVAMLAVFIITNSFIFATTGDDPHDTPWYPSQDNGQDYNYNYDIESGDGALLGHVVVNPEGGQKATYKPGDEVFYSFTISSSVGDGDGANGNGGIKDLLLYMFTNSGDPIGSEFGRFPDGYGSLDNVNDLIDLSDGGQITTPIFKYTVPEADPGSTLYLYFTLYDYGMFTKLYDEDLPSENMESFQSLSVSTNLKQPLWMHTETARGEIPFTIADEETIQYTITASTNPVGVTASFTGLGTYDPGYTYNVNLSSYDTANWNFTGFSQSQTGTLTSNINLVANFTPRTTPPPVVVTYKVTATSQPAGVATFVGTSDALENGSSYKVYYDITDNNYEFVEWIGLSEGTINNADVALIAVFKEKEIIIPPTVIPEEPVVTEPAIILDEEVAEEVTAENVELPETGGIPLELVSLMGATFIGIGTKIRKKNNK